MDEIYELSNYSDIPIDNDALNDHKFKIKIKKNEGLNMIRIR